jgi:hypothetical protein
LRTLLKSISAVDHNETFGSPTSASQDSKVPSSKPSK